MTQIKRTVTRLETQHLETQHTVTGKYRCDHISDIRGPDQSPPARRLVHRHHVRLAALVEQAATLVLRKNAQRWREIQIASVAERGECELRCTAKCEAVEVEQ